jgi:plasmid maintenance system antidote protein VapI
MGKPKTFLETLHAYIAKAGSQRAAAELLGVKESYISDVIRGQKPVSQTLAEKLNFKWELVRK